MIDWFLAFLLTCAIELPLVAAVAPRGRRRRTAVDSIAINLVTHPLAWLAVTGGWLPWGGTEILVTLAEATLYVAVARLALPRAVLAALLANGVTAALSFAL
ncbi:MAG: hypothetical protein KDE27_23360 [Planctomycetes bacterium]|nr:hypothetical protein [Planctomycetota bacterium]